MLRQQLLPRFPVSAAGTIEQFLGIPVVASHHENHPRI
jgi:hypothetical protein